MGEKMPKNRFRHYCAIVLMTICLSLLFAYLNGLMMDGTVSYLFIDAVYLAVLLYTLETNRIHLRIGNNSFNHYGMIAVCYGICCIVVTGCYFLPAFTFPAAGIALFLGICSNIEIATISSTFLCLILCMATGGNFYEFAAYILLLFTGAQMAKTMQEKKYRLWGCMILTAVSVAIPMLFYYLSYAESRLSLLFWNGAFAGFVLILYHISADRLYDKTAYSKIDFIEKILKEDYPLVQDMKNYSKAEYVHAMKVATIARKCAAEIGADEMIATAAGFYYRLGILEGEPFIENGIHLAMEKCFPDAIIKILSEYNGEERLPTSKESAIVHMVDACLKKIELLMGNNLSSSWNQDMVIYQTLNELSATGIYDESGLSMNQFLKLRELLVREEISYDNND